jgi:uncharacterized protein (TIGR02118 family)
VSVERSLQFSGGAVVVKIVAFVRRRDGLDYADFVRYWQEHHAHVVAKLPGLRRYIQNPAIDMNRDWPYDGMAELWFDDMDAVRSAFRSEESARVREDEPNFTSTIDWFMATEFPVLDGS